MNISELISAKIDPRDESGFRVFADYLPQLIWTCDAAGQGDYLNRHWQEFTGISYSSRGKAWRDQVHSEDRVRLDNAWTHSTRTGKALSLELRLRRYDGVYHWFDCRAQPVRDEFGNVVKWFGIGIDVQERVDARRGWLHGEQRFHDLYHSAPVAICLEDWRAVMTALQQLRAAGVDDFAHYFDLHPEFVQRMLATAKVIDVNNWSLRVFRAERKEQMLGPLKKFFATPAALAGFVRKLVGIANGERTILNELELCAVDGSLLRVLSSVVMTELQNEQGLVLVSQIDITDRYRAEAQVQQQQALLGRMSHLAKVGGWEIDVNTMEGTWTNEVPKIHELPLGQRLVVKDVLTRCYSDAARARIEQALHLAAEQGKRFDIEEPMVTAKQSHRWVRVQGVPVYEHGQVVRIEGAIQDITERKQTECALQALNANLKSQVADRTTEADRARRRLQSTLDALPVMVGYWDKQLRLRFANRAYSEARGVSADQLLGRHYAEIYGTQQYAWREPDFAAVLRGEKVVREMLVNSADGKHSQHVQTHYLPNQIYGEVQGFYVLVSDITELKNAENALRGANQELEAFAYAVAHDLRAPLRALSGFSNALLEDFSGRMDQEAQEFAIEISRASHRMAELIEGLLALSRSTQGSMRREYIDLTAMAKHIAAELQQQDPKRDVSWQIAENLYAGGDTHMIELVMRNLLGNAWKYTQKEAASCISFDAINEAGQRVFRVIDNGAGFDMAHADRLFKPFQRLHRQDEFTGIGIGLATVQRIVRRHGGEITAMATPGKGAEFRFSLDNVDEGMVE